MVERLSLDLDLDWDDVLEHIDPGATIGRPHIADALVAKRIVKSREVAFSRYLHTGSPYFVAHYAPDPVRAAVEGKGELPVESASGSSVLR